METHSRFRRKASPPVDDRPSAGSSKRRKGEKGAISNSKEELVNSRVQS